MESHFREVQRFNQWWLWSLLLGLTLIPSYGVYRQIIIGEPWGSKPMSDLLLIIFATLMLGLVIFLAYIKLVTIIDDEGIVLRFSPFQKRQFEWSEIKSVQVLDYGFVGGWGVRLTSKFGTVYNVKGTDGLLVHFKNGKRITIGTQKPKMLKTSISGLKPDILEL